MDKNSKPNEEVENGEALKWAHFLYSVYRKKKEREQSEEPIKT